MTNPFERAANSPKYLLGAGFVFLLVIVAAFLALRSVQSSDSNDQATGSDVVAGSDAASAAGQTPADGVQSPAIGGQQEASGNDEGNRAGFDPDGPATESEGSDDPDDDDPDSDDPDDDDPDEGNGQTTTETTLADGDPGDPCDNTTSRRNFEIRFAPGAVEETVSNQLDPGSIDRYSIDVGAQQIMNIELTTSAEAGFSLISPTGTVIAFDVDSLVETTQQGTYQICLMTLDRDADYSLRVSVIDDSSPTKISAPWCGSSVNDRGDIKFAAGTSSGLASNAVIRGERDLYRFGASEGQEAALLLTALEDNAEFLVRTPSGATLVDGVDFEGFLPESGEYEVCIGGTRGNASYDLTLVIL